MTPTNAHRHCPAPVWDQCMISTSLLSPFHRLLSPFHRPGKNKRANWRHRPPVGQQRVVRYFVRSFMPCRLRTGLEHLTDFRQQDSEVTQSRLVAERDELTSSINDRRYRVGRLSMPTLDELRARVSVPLANGVRSLVAADIRVLHAEPEL
jgi:hypothetical protein